MLERSTGLSDSAREAIARLEAATVRHDGGRLKLEWGALSSRPPDTVSDVLAWDGDELVGFAGLYAFGSPTVEVTGMVHPSHRGRGIGAALLDDALALAAVRDHHRFLLVVPRESRAAAHLAAVRGGVLEHSEHALVLHGEVTASPSDPSIEMRPATRGDAAEIGRILTAAFGESTEPVDPVAPSHPTLVATRDGEIVATMRVHLEDDAWGVYGFAVTPALQGQGIGRDMLHRVCVQARGAGAATVHLEVAVDNDRALGLYTSLGFIRATTEDYYELAVGSSAPRAR